MSFQSPVRLTNPSRWKWNGLDFHIPGFSALEGEVIRADPVAIGEDRPVQIVVDNAILPSLFFLTEALTP